MTSTTTTDHRLSGPWDDVVKSWPEKKNSDHVKQLARKGIPSEFRGIVWQVLADAHSSHCVSDLDGDNQQPTDHPGDLLRKKYHDYLKATSPCEKLILLDIERTFSQLEYFRDEKGQSSLFNVVKAYSIHDAEVGYCQGSTFLVGLLLLNMPEEDAFSLLVKLMEEYRLREMFKPTMTELGLCIYQLESMVQEMLPQLHRHFERQNFHPSMFASSWFLTLFTSSLPIDLASRVIDLFLVERMDIIFRLSIAILIICREDILKLDMESLIKYFKKDMPRRVNIDPDYLIHQSFKVKFDPQKMKKLSEDFSIIKKREEAEMVTLRRLQTENRLLGERIKNLEKESTELANKIIESQVTRAKEAEDCLALKNELNQLRRKCESDLKKEIDKFDQILLEHNKEFESIIGTLQEELIAVKLREAETIDESKVLRRRIAELEEVIHRLKNLPEEETMAQLQEELIAVKLREAEAKQSLKDMREKVLELSAMWEEHLLKTRTQAAVAAAIDEPAAASTMSNTIKMAVKRVTDKTGDINQLKHELFSAKLRESLALADVKELRQQLMELEEENKNKRKEIRTLLEENKKRRQIEDCLKAKVQELTDQLDQEKKKVQELMGTFEDAQESHRRTDIDQSQTISHLTVTLSQEEDVQDM